MRFLRYTTVEELDNIIERSFDKMLIYVNNAPTGTPSIGIAQGEYSPVVANEILFKYTNSTPLRLDNLNEPVGQDINGNNIYAVEIDEEKSDDTNIFVKLSGDLSYIIYFGSTINNWNLSDEVWFGPDVVSCQPGALHSIDREKVHTTNPNADIETGWQVQ